MWFISAMLPRHSIAIQLLLCQTLRALILPNIGDKAVTHATDAATVERWLSHHCTSATVLGFDTETRPVFKKGQRPNPPCVVQLSTMDACLVAQIYEPRKNAAAIREALKNALLNRRVLMAGVGIDDDAIDLWQHWGLALNGRIELSGEGKQPRGLRQLCLEATGIELSKSSSVQCSNWATALSETQIKYAAADAWAGSAIYNRLCALDEATFGYDAVCRFLDGEQSCSTRELEPSRFDPFRDTGSPPPLPKCCPD